jgi:hypothetical protein
VDAELPVVLAEGELAACSGDRGHGVAVVMAERQTPAGSLDVVDHDLHLMPQRAAGAGIAEIAGISDRPDASEGAMPKSGRIDGNEAVGSLGVAPKVIGAPATEIDDHLACFTRKRPLFQGDHDTVAV